MKEEKDWLKLKKYVHFSPHFEKTHKPFIKSYVSDPEKVSKHRFYPFIHYSIKDNKFKRLIDENTGERNQKREKKEKSREIFYSDHLDSCIFSYYSKLINEKLKEIYLANEELNNSVIAYRAIEFDNHRSKCNIDFANEVFQFIEKSNDLELSVLCFDVKSFFDSLDHKILKKAWYELFNQKNLPLDHYAVYKAITKFTFVEIGDLIAEFEELNIQKFIYLKQKKIKSFCKSGKEFRERVKDKGLINFNKYDSKNKKVKKHGIPQGSPISATLSNLYLLQFDKLMTEKATNLGGFYRRYSDDILFICPVSKVGEIKKFVYEYVDKELSLIVQDEKTQEVVFYRATNRDKWSYYTNENGIKKQIPLSYLGFDFDGKTVRVRQKSLSLYYRKVKRLIRRKANYATVAKIYNLKNPLSPQKDDWIYRKRIYVSKSHLGARRKRVKDKVFWGNYISYMKTASVIMKQPAIKKQVRNHWRIIESEIKEFETNSQLKKTPSRKKKYSQNRK